MEQMEKDEKVKTAVPLKYLSNFRRSLEMPLIELSLGWIENCVLSGGETINAGAVVKAGTAANFKITDAKLYVPIVTYQQKRL